MILAIAKDQTTLYDQIKYQGDPKSFAWVLPIHGVVTVGLSADAVFGSLDRVTQTQVQQPILKCPAPPSCPSDQNDSFAGAPTSMDGSAPSDSGSVVVTKDEVVGPYESVQISATDPTALDAWLTKNGFVVPADVRPIVDAYLKDGFDFLVLKLLPGQGVQSMRPVRVTTPGAGAVLPLRMVSAGTGAQTGITLWVIADGRYEPANFPQFVIRDEELVWDWKTRMSNYRTLRAAKQAATKNHGWEIESSLSLSAFQVEGPVRNTFDASQDYAPTTGPNPQTPAQVRDADMATLFHGQSPMPRITRMRADLARDALVQDLSLNASQDQSEISNVRSVGSDVNRPPCPTYPPCNKASSFGGFAGAGCAVESEGSMGGNALTLGALGFVGIAITRMRRKKKSA